METLEWESMLYHSWEELIVYCVGEQFCIAFYEVFENFEVCLTLGEAATVFDSHGLSDDEFRYLAIGSINSFVVDIVGIALGTLYDL